MSPALPTALGVGAKRIIKELKVLKSRCIFAPRCCVPGRSRSPGIRLRGGGWGGRGETKDEEVECETRSKGTEERRGGYRGTKKGPEAEEEKKRETERGGGQGKEGEAERVRSV